MKKLPMVGGGGFNSTLKGINTSSSKKYLPAYKKPQPGVGGSYKVNQGKIKKGNGLTKNKF